VFNRLVKAGRQAAKKLTGQIVEAVEEDVDPLRSNLATSHENKEEEKPQETVSEKA
jgi:hypothetical protein